MNKHRTKVCNAFSQLVNFKREKSHFSPNLALEDQGQNYKVTEILKDNKKTVGVGNSS